MIIRKLEGKKERKKKSDSNFDFQIIKKMIYLRFYFLISVYFLIIISIVCMVLIAVIKQ